MADRDFGLFRYGERAEYAFTGYGLKQLKESFLPQFGRGDWCGAGCGRCRECDRAGRSLDRVQRGAG